MARPGNIQNVLDSFLQRLGAQVAKGVTEGIQNSGLLRQLRKSGKSSGSGKRGRKPGTSKTCSDKACTLAARAKGLCSKHYQQQRYAQTHGAAKVAKVDMKKKRVTKAAKKVAPGKAKAAPVAKKRKAAAETKE